MKFLRTGLLPVGILCVLVSLQACKAKKLPSKPVQPQQTSNTPPPAPAPRPQPAVTSAPPPAPAPKPDYNFSNVQFEFNSSILKTDAYPLLDKAAAAMKMDPTVQFNLDGYASIEGTEEYNVTLSQDRANSVKTYLVNSGVSSGQLTAKGHGTANPVGDNSTEAGRILNRRVEIHKQ
jgi:OOP family OmpA-OmpF porin